MRALSKSKDKDVPHEKKFQPETVSRETFQSVFENTVLLFEVLSEVIILFCSHFPFLGSSFIHVTAEMQNPVKNDSMNLIFRTLPQNHGIVLYPISTYIHLSFYRKFRIRQLKSYNICIEVML